MLRSISQSGGELVLCIDSGEFVGSEIPDAVLTADELAQVRAVVPGALPDYAPYVAPIVEAPVEPDAL